MATPNQAMQAPQKGLMFAATITKEGYQKLINRTLGDPERAKRFTAAIISAVRATPALQDCNIESVVTAALVGEALNLSPSPQLGQYYIVPYGGNAQFIPGYKGLMQLAQRSGQLRALDCVEVKKGELVRADPFKGVYEFDPIQDPATREAAETVGYYAYFEMLNGFRKEIYWSRGQVESHGRRFSKAFNSTFWQKSFDEMARKTLLRQLITKHGCPMSTELATAIEKDGAAQAVDPGTGDMVTIPEASDGYDAVPQADLQPPAVGDGQPAGLDDLK